MKTDAYVPAMAPARGVRRGDVDEDGIPYGPEGWPVMSISPELITPQLLTLANDLADVKWAAVEMRYVLRPNSIGYTVAPSVRDSDADRRTYLARMAELKQRFGWRVSIARYAIANTNFWNASHALWAETLDDATKASLHEVSCKSGDAIETALAVAEQALLQAVAAVTEAAVALVEAVAESAALVAFGLAPPGQLLPALHLRELACNAPRPGPAIGVTAAA